MNSDPDVVMIDTTNSPPVAGANQTVLDGDIVTLDGSLSDDVNGDAIDYLWALTATPAGSAATLDNPTVVMPSFVSDVPGGYVAQLIVTDGFANSAPATVLITVEAVTVGNRPFADFTIHKAKVKLHKGKSKKHSKKSAKDKDHLDIKGWMTLGDGTDGIDLLTETVTVTLDGLSWTIPACSFIRDDESFKFKGAKAGGLNITIRDDGRFKIKANRLALGDVDFSGLVSFSLLIGNDIGETDLLVKVKGPEKSKKHSKK